MESDGDSFSTPSSEDPIRSTSDASSDDSDSPPTHRPGILRGGDSDTDGMSWPSRLPKGSTYRQQERRRRRDAKRSVRFDVDLTQRRTNRMVKAIPNGPDPPVGSQSGDRLPDTHNFRQAEKLAGKSNSLLFARRVRIPGNQPQQSDGTNVDNTDSALGKSMATEDRPSTPRRR